MRDRFTHVECDGIVGGTPISCPIRTACRLIDLPDIIQIDIEPFRCDDDLHRIVQAILHKQSLGQPLRLTLCSNSKLRVPVDVVAPAHRIGCNKSWAIMAVVSIDGMLDPQLRSDTSPLRGQHHDAGPRDVKFAGWRTAST